jgi:hypothetical protein
VIRTLASLLSFVVPGLGQVLRGRVRDGLLFFWGAVWFHVMALGALVAVYPRLEDPTLTLAVGAFGVPRGLAVPEAVVLTAVFAALHVWAARDAYRWGRDTTGRRDRGVDASPHPHPEWTTGEVGTRPTSPG